MKTTSIATIALFCVSLSAQSFVLLEDGKRPKTNRWSIEGPNSDNASIQYVNNEKGGGNVVKLKGFGLYNSFIFRGEKGYPLSFNDKVIHWKMKYNEPFIIEVQVNTNKGKIEILYSDLKNNIKIDDACIQIGLGSRFNDGTWHTVIRDVQEDISLMLSNDIKVQNINTVTFKGSGLVDDIMVMDKKPTGITITNSEHMSRKWQLLGRSGRSSVERDPVLGQVFKFDSAGSDAVFQLRKSGGWNLSLTPLLQWKIKMLSDCKVYVVVETSVGNYILVYDGNVKADLYDQKKRMIHYGIPEYSTNNKWNVINRDINEDIKRVVPNADIIRMSGILLKGSGYVSEIKLLPDKIYGLELIRGWEVYDNDPAGAVVTAINDLEYGEAVGFTGNSLKNGYKYTGKHGSLSESVNNPFIKWDMRFAEVFDIMVAIESDSVVRYIHYVSMPTDYLRIKDGELYIGLGDTSTDRRWRTVVRDLSADVKLLSKEAGYTSSKYLLVRGSGRMGNIQFFDTLPNVDEKHGPSISASVAIGQYDFGHNLKNLWGKVNSKNNGLSSPNAVTVDQNGRIYIADSANNRIMVWKHIPETFGTGADVIFNNGLNNPSGVFAIGKQLLIADTGNDRVLIFDLPFDEDSIPRLKIEGYLKEPKAVFSDGRNLFIADTGNNRVLIWNYLPSRKIRSFDVVLGQSNGSGYLPNKGKEFPNYNTMSSPSGIYSDGKALYVADTGNNRVLVFKELPTMNGWHADIVIGQDNFGDPSQNKGGKVSASSLKNPESVFVSDDRLYICDTGNNRVVIYNIKEEFKVADGVIGQSSFVSSWINSPNGLPSSNTLFIPTSVFTKNGIIYIADKGNNRVLIY